MNTPHGFMNLGGQEFNPDGTEYKLKLGSATAIPETYMPDSFFNRRVFYQRQIPDCGANAGAFAAALIDEHENQEYSPDYQWIDIKTFDGYSLADGTDMKSIFTSLKKGSLPYNLLPEKTTLPLSQFSSQSRVTSSMRNEAKKHVVEAYGFHVEPLNMAALKNLIYTNKAVVVLIRLGDEFWTDKNGVNSWNEKDILPLRNPKSVVSGHFIVLGAYDQNRIYFANWWSQDWGMKGYGYFESNYLPQITQVGTLVDSLDKVQVPAFSRDLYVGVSGEDVKRLQQYLNSHGFPVSTGTAPGAVGHETTYFGNATQKALQAFQKAKGINPPAGYFGPLTRQYIALHD